MEMAENERDFSHIWRGTFHLNVVFMTPETILSGQLCGYNPGVSYYIYLWIVMNKEPIDNQREKGAKITNFGLLPDCHIKIFTGK